LAQDWTDRLTDRSIGWKQGWIERARAPGRGGFSLVELLVVMAIVALLAGLLLPAVQAARESARRGVCQQNLRQLAVAVLTYEAGLRRLPAAAIVSEAASPATCTGCWNPWAEAQLSAFTPGTKHGSSWILAVLPFLEQSQLFNRWNRSTNVLGNAAVAQTDIPTLHCPSRRTGVRIDRDDHKNLIRTNWRGGGTDYGGCYGRGDGFLNDTSDDHRFSDIDTPIGGSSGNRQGLFLPNAGRLLSAAVDGLANTIMLGELQRLRPLAGATGAVNTYNRTSQDGWAVGGVATLFTTATDPGHSNPGGMNNLFFESPGSDHAGGSFFAMADGSVRWLGEFVDAKDNNAVFPLLGSIGDGAVARVADTAY
jgi:prepilin-type N-terminal cleavage/methylation domain-containing protein